MGLFNKKNERTLSFGLGGYKFTSDDEHLSYRSVYGQSFRIARKDIESVSLDKEGFFALNYLIKINGSGTTLTQLKLPPGWAEKAQEFIMKEALGGTKKTLGLSELETLSNLKEKGIISQAEFETKKGQILGS